MSPGTISTVAMVTFSLLRTTEAVGELRLLSESIVFSALNSCLLGETSISDMTWIKSLSTRTYQNPTTIFRAMTAAITPPSIQDLMPKLTAMARMST